MTQKTVNGLLEHKRFRAAYDFQVLRAQSGEKTVKHSAEWWTELQEVDTDTRASMIAKLKIGKAKKRKRPPQKNGSNKKVSKNSSEYHR